MELIASVTRVLGFVGKELVETIRRPSALLSLVVGPLLLILAFGAGYDGNRRELRALIVVPPDSGLPTDPAAYTSDDLRGIRILDVTADRAAAEQALAEGRTDLVVAAPADLSARFRAGQQSVIDIDYSLVDPIRVAEADFLARQVAADANRALIELVVKEGESRGLTVTGGTAPIPPAVVAAPTRAQTRNLAPTTPAVTSFFGAGALALILQHLAVTLLALSLVRERRGRLEIFRVAPVSAFEILAGKALGYAVLGGVVSIVTMAALVGPLGVPMLAGPIAVAGVLALLLAASLALGALIAGVSDTERQAVQLSLLLLLASVFFGGFVLAVDEFRPAAQVVSFLLPVTHGIALLQDLMLRGTTTGLWQAAALAALAAAMGVAGWALLHRAMVRR